MTSTFRAAPALRQATLKSDLFCFSPCYIFSYYSRTPYARSFCLFEERFSPARVSGTTRKRNDLVVAKE
jgi:hypothetical protein